MFRNLLKPVLAFLMTSQLAMSAFALEASLSEDDFQRIHMIQGQKELLEQLNALTPEQRNELFLRLEDALMTLKLENSKLQTQLAAAQYKETVIYVNQIMQFAMIVSGVSAGATAGAQVLATKQGVNEIQPARIRQLSMIKNSILGLTTLFAMVSGGSYVIAGSENVKVEDIPAMKIASEALARRLAREEVRLKALEAFFAEH